MWFGLDLLCQYITLNPVVLQDQEMVDFVQLDQIAYTVLLCILQILWQSMDDQITDYEKQLCDHFLDLFESIVTSPTTIQTVEKESLQRLVVSMVGAVSSFYSYTEIL